MTFIAIVGSAVASTLLSKVFSKAIETKGQPSSDKNPFQLMLEQFSPKEKTDDVGKAAVVGTISSESDVGGKPEGPFAIPGQAPLNTTSGESAGMSRHDGKASLEDLLASLEAKEAKEANAASVVAILQRAAQLRASYEVNAAQSAASKAISAVA